MSKPRMPSASDHSITEMLHQLSSGRTEVRDQLMEKVYEQLHQLAVYQMRREPVGHTLQPTALVNEAYLRLIADPRTPVADRSHFFALAARAMRHVLVDHARGKRAEKREGHRRQVTLHDWVAATGQKTVDVLVIHQLLTRLEELDPRQAGVVEMRFFGGMDFEEIARVLNYSSRTAKRDWEMARSWFLIQLKPGL